ncbi:MAG TPA: PilN domain-containing protein [Longimicrobium sp.]|jgi:Tfp pilus assembly protein PilN
MTRTDSTDRKPPRRVQLAIALAPERMVAVSGPAARMPEVLESELSPAARGGDWPELDEALGALAAALGASGGTLDVALLGRLAHAKVVPLPPVRRAELGALVARNARRHFAVRDESLVADAVRVERVRSGAPAATLAAVAPEAIVEAVGAAAQACGFTLGRIVPGAVALAEAVRARVPAARRGRVGAVARTRAGVEVVILREGTLEAVHPITAGPAEDAASLAERIVATLRPAAEWSPLDGLVVCGAAEDDHALRDALSRRGDAPPPLAAAGVQQIPAEAVLALGAALARDSVPQLMPAAMVRARARLQQKRNVVLVAASALLLLIAAGFHLHGLNRELDAVLARRAEIAPAVRRARETRAGVEEVRMRLTALAALERDAPEWTAEVAALARALPDSAHLTTLTADSVSVRLGGIARSASAVVPALEASPRLARVALAAPVRWEAGDAGERFDIAATRETRP